MHGRADLGQLTEQLDIGRRLVEVVVPNQAAIGLATELTVFLFVHLLEDRALIPGRALELLQGLVQLRLGDVEHANLQLLIALGVVDQVVQATPGAFHLLEIAVVDDLIDLGGKLGIDGGDDRLDRLDRIVGDQIGLRQGLLSQGTHGRFHRFLGALGLGFEFLHQQRSEFAGLLGIGQCGLVVLQLFAHGGLPNQAWGSLSWGFGALARACSNAGSLIAFMITSSAPVLPSM